MSQWDDLSDIAVAISIGMGVVKTNCLYIWYGSKYLRKKSKCYKKDMHTAYAEIIIMSCC